MNSIAEWSQDIRRQIRDAEMDEDIIHRHQRRVVEALARTESRKFPILDTCRIENGGISRLPQRLVPSGQLYARDSGIVAFVPAAGASSRYLTPLIPLMDAARARDIEATRGALGKLALDGVTECPLPRSIQALMEALNARSNHIPDHLFDDVVREIDAPKALYPAVLDGDTFLRMKRLEHAAIGGFLGEIYISPPGRINDFAQEAAKLEAPTLAKFIEQDVSLATLRFEANGQVALDGHGHVSPVPAGHGALLNLLPQVPVMYPGAKAVFIRNIDNVSGNASDVVDVTRNFMECFSTSLALLENLRDAVRHRDHNRTLELSLSWLEFWGCRITAKENAFQLLLEQVFHTTPATDHAVLTRIMERPLVLMGQVPNTTKDIGGTCVFTNIDGRRVKLCLELPHASDADRQEFLEKPLKATHFNPVFVLAEIPCANAMLAWNDHPFWLVARKSWQGRDVFYQESILYEMLGCSDYANVVFTEVPRCVFNPHKSLNDAGQKRLSDWIKK